MFCWVFTKLEKFFCTGCKGGPVWEIVYKAPGITIGGLMSDSIVSGSTHHFGLQLGADAAGNNPGTLPGPVTWTVDNSAGATLVPSADTTTVTLTAGAVGTVNLTATSGSVTATLAITVTAGHATSMTIVELAAAAPAPAPAATVA